MRLRIRRLGGIAGVTLRIQLDTAELPADQASKVEGALRGLAGHPPAEPPRPDGFRYEITPLGEGDLDPVVIGEQEMPPELKGLAEAVAKSGEIESR